MKIGEMIGFQVFKIFDMMLVYRFVQVTAELVEFGVLFVIPSQLPSIQRRMDLRGVLCQTQILSRTTKHTPVAASATNGMVSSGSNSSGWELT